MASYPESTWQALANRLGISVKQAQRTAELLEDGNTPPFIARFRQDLTEGLEEAQIREIRQGLRQLQLLAERRQSILRVVRERGALTDDLAQRLAEADSHKLLEDLYLPFKRKKETKAARARQKGLGPLAEEAMTGTLDVESLTQKAVAFTADTDLDAREALDGIKDLVVEAIAERINVRQKLRSALEETGVLVASKFVEPPASSGDGTDSSGDGTDSSGDGTDSSGDGTDSSGDGADSPGDGADSPGDGADSSGDGADSPGDGADSPGDGADSPGDGADSLGDGADSLGDGADSSGDGADSPGDGADSPGDGADSPGDGADSLGDGADSLGDGADSSGDGADSPGDGADSPGDGADSPGDGADSLGDGADSPGETGEPDAAPPTEQAASASATGTAEPPSDPASDAAEEGNQGGFGAPAAGNATGLDPNHQGDEVAPAETDVEEVPEADFGANILDGASLPPPDGDSCSESVPTAGAAPDVTPPENPEYPETASKEGATGSTSASSKTVKLPAGVATADERRQQRRQARRRKREQLEASFKDYFHFSESLEKLPPHRVLAINRGERVRVLKVRIKGDSDALFALIRPDIVADDAAGRSWLEGCVREALQRQLIPSLDREIRRDMTDRAEAHALKVFARNLRHLLLQPPVHQRVMAVDPGLRFGCKVVALDEYGTPLAHTTIHAIGDAERVTEGRRRMAELIEQHQLNVIAIGNGTGCRQAETTVATLLEEHLSDRDIAYVIVNEAGASVYSTGELATRELPDHDARTRGAISIGRRLLDPLSELVKIDPGNLGIGMYQHDVRQKHLQDLLDEVVASSVNYVGVDLNTASPALLRYVSGLNQRTAREIFEYRKTHGRFESREQLKQVPGVGESTYEQAAGFLMVYGGVNPLDATRIHPESYAIAQEVLNRLGRSLEDVRTEVEKLHPASAPAATSGDDSADTTTADAPSTLPCESPSTTESLPQSDGDQAAANHPTAESDTSSASGPQADGEPASASQDSAGGAPAADAAATVADASSASSASTASSASSASSASTASTASSASTASTEWFRPETLDVTSVAEKLAISERQVRDVIGTLRRAGRDPREDFPPPLFRRGIMRLEDLRPGMELSATVLNVVDFGAFVDVGLRDSGLIHISQLADRFVRDPHELVSVGDILRVWVLQVDKQRRRISLTTFPPGSEPVAKPTRSRPPKSRGTRPSDKPERSANAGPPRKPRRRPVKPAKPITDGMVEGKEPMRTFGDLAQYFQVTREKEPKKKGNKRHGK